MAVNRGSEGGGPQAETVAVPQKSVVPPPIIWQAIENRLLGVTAAIAGYVGDIRHDNHRYDLTVDSDGVWRVNYWPDYRSPVRIGLYRTEESAKKMANKHHQLTKSHKYP